MRTLEPITVELLKRDADTRARNDPTLSGCRGGGFSDDTRCTHSTHSTETAHAQRHRQGEPIPRTHVPACMSHVCLCVCVCDGHWTVRGECGRWTGRAPSSCGLSPCRTEGRREPKLGRGRVIAVVAWRINVAPSN